MTSPNTADGGPVVKIDGLKFRWTRNGPWVLDLPALEMQRGKHLFIGGPSGSGKSTLLSLLAAVTRPTTGSLSVLGKDIGALGDTRRDRFRADHIGYIFQMFNLIPYLSMVDNVLLPCRFSVGRQARALARSASLQDEALRLLGHLDLAEQELLERPVTTLSVGQQQRVAAARALIGAPEIVIADEPTSALDSNRRETFIRLLFDECHAAGATLLFVSHEEGLADLFETRLALDELNHASTTVT